MPEASSTASMSDLGAELATASGQRPARANTASTAPGSSGRWVRYSSFMAAMTCSAMVAGGSGMPKSSLM